VSPPASSRLTRPRRVRWSSWRRAVHGALGGALLSLLVVGGACGGEAYETRASQDVAASGHGLIGAAEALEFARSVGARPTGTWSDIEAREFITLALQQYGLVPRTQEFLIEEGPAAGLLSSNIIVTKEGTAGSTVVVGAHYDTDAGSPGPPTTPPASGCCSSWPPACARWRRRHRSSSSPSGPTGRGRRAPRFFVESLRSYERKALLGMIDLDAVAGGGELWPTRLRRRRSGCVTRS
jgi:hypothetical protein